jgi:N-dimethylarginine dimethylaminohydrolase
MSSGYYDSPEFSERLYEACTNDKSDKKGGLNVADMKSYYKKKFNKSDCPLKREELRKILSPESGRKTKNLVIRGLQFEGGDILLNDDHIFVGLSHQKAEHGCATTEEIITEINKIFGDKKVIGVELSKETLHLDIVFNILPFNNSCVVYPGGIYRWKKFKKVLEQRFDKIYEVSSDEADSYVCNFMNTGPDKMIVSDSDEMRNLVKKWKNDSLNLRVEYIDFLYIYSFLGGSIRCSSFPVRRTSSENIESNFSVNNEIDPLRVCVIGKLTPDKKSELCRTAYGDIAVQLTKNKVSRNFFLAKIENGLESLTKAMENHGVIVLRPDKDLFNNVPACNMIFCRDVATVIDSNIFVAKLHLEHRGGEFDPTLRSIDDYFDSLV